MDLKTLKLNVDIAREALRVAERTYVDALALAALHAQGIARLFDEDPVSMCSLRFELCPRRKTG